jgi:ABC-type antimicrobial peptide transport system permease subunit
MREGVTIVGIGLVLGLCLAAAASPVLAMLLSGVNPHDLASFAIPAGVLLLTSMTAAYGPALRGTKIPPMQALRTE